jgi:hypothetical protein
LPQLAQIHSSSWLIQSVGQISPAAQGLATLIARFKAVNKWRGGLIPVCYVLAQAFWVNSKQCKVKFAVVAYIFQHFVNIAS